MPSSDPDPPPQYVTHAELDSQIDRLMTHLKDLADQQTRTLDERIKALTWRGLFAVGAAVGVIRWDNPDPLTVGAVALAIGTAAVKAITVVMGGRSL